MPSRLTRPFWTATKREISGSSSKPRESLKIVSSKLLGKRRCGSTRARFPNRIYDSLMRLEERAKMGITKHLSLMPQYLQSSNFEQQWRTPTGGFLIAFGKTPEQDRKFRLAAMRNAGMNAWQAGIGSVNSIYIYERALGTIIGIASKFGDLNKSVDQPWPEYGTVSALRMSTC